MIFGQFIVEIRRLEVTARKGHILSKFTRVPSFVQTAIIGQLANLNGESQRHDDYSDPMSERSP
jgi:hypothetical protein